MAEKKQKSEAPEKPKDLFMHWVLIAALYVVFYSINIDVVFYSINIGRFYRTTDQYSNTAMYALVGLLIFLFSLLPLVFGYLCVMLVDKWGGNRALALWMGVIFSPIALLVYYLEYRTEHRGRKR
jgi:hypothetical protein